MARQAATALAAAESRLTFTFVNRTPEKARRMAEAFGGRWRPLDRLTEALAEAHVVITCTGAPVAVIDVDTVRAVLARSLGRRPHLDIIDMAVPRDVAPDVGDIEGVRVYTIDDLRELAPGLANRIGASMDHLHGMIDHAVERFAAWLARRRAERAVALLAASFDEVRREEVARAARKIAGDEHAAKVLESLSRRLASKLLHRPVERLKALDDRKFSAREYELIAHVFNGSVPTPEGGTEGSRQNRDEAP